VGQIWIGADTVRVCAGALSGFEEEHAAAQNTLCTEQLVDGAQTAAGTEWISVSKNSKWDLKRGQKPEKAQLSPPKPAALK
jgi:hypothetical protein